MRRATAARTLRERCSACAHAGALAAWLCGVELCVVDVNSSILVSSEVGIAEGNGSGGIGAAIGVGGVTEGVLAALVVGFELEAVEVVYVLSACVAEMFIRGDHLVVFE